MGQCKAFDLLASVLRLWLQHHISCYLNVMADFESYLDANRRSGLRECSASA